MALRYVWTSRLHSHKGAQMHGSRTRMLQDAGKEHLGVAQDVMRCLGEESKAGKGMDLGDLERNNTGIRG